MIEYPCGCKFPTNEAGKPIFDPDVAKLPFDCTATWDLISEGNTKGVFQLDSHLGQGKAAEAKPRTMEELADLIAILRPGTGDAMVDGKSLTQHYLDRKAGIDDVRYFHPLLEPILKSTYDILVYQEQAMQIARLVAGFTLQQAEILRKAIGKKKVKLMAQVKEEFIAGAAKLGTFTAHDTLEIFSWIEKSQKYSFNKSHSVCYAYNAFQHAYSKTHFPRAFLTACLRAAPSRIKPLIEVNELVNNARSMDIDVDPPSILHMKPDFFLLDNRPTFGLTNVKGVGLSVFEQLQGRIKNQKYDLSQMTWAQFLMALGTFIKSNSFEAMISAGVFDCYKLTRAQMLYEFNIYKDLKDKDKKFLITSTSTELVPALKQLKHHILNDIKQTVHTVRRADLVEGAIVAILNPPYELIDLPSWKAKIERELFGIELTCHELYEYDTGSANCTCREYIKGFDESHIAIAAQIDDVREWAVKRGQNKGNVMGYLKISDGTCCMDSVTIFSDDWKKIKDQVQLGKIVLLRGTRDKKRGSFLVKRVQKLTSCI